MRRSRIRAATLCLPQQPPSRCLIILPARLGELISKPHEADPAEHSAIYRRYESELLE